MVIYDSAKKLIRNKLKQKFEYLHKGIVVDRMIVTMTMLQIEEHENSLKLLKLVTMHSEQLTTIILSV